MIGAEFERVLARAQVGDELALERIYRDVSPLVVGYLRSSGAVEPEDVASEVFISVVRGLASFVGDESKFRSWVLTITHHRLTDAIRHRGRRPERPVVLEELAHEQFASRDAENEAMARLRARGVLDAIDRLTDDQRAVLLLRVLADLTVPQIALAVGKSESAVKALLRRALAGLARQLEDHPDPEQRVDDR